MNLTKKPAHYSQTLESLNKAIELNPKEKKLYWNRAQIYIDLKQFPQAIHDYTMAMHIEPECSDTHLALAKIYESTGNIEAALMGCLHAFYVRPHQPPSNHHFLGTLFLKVDRKTSALNAFKSALSLEPNDIHSLLDLGITYYNMGLTDTSIEVFRKLLTIDPQCGPAYFNLANALTKKALFEEADLAYQKSFKLLPQAKALIYNCRAVHNDNQNNLTDALQDINQALKLDPNLHMARINRAMFLLKMGKCQEGWKDYQARYAEPKWKLLAHRPRWRGENLNARRLLVCCDEGDGDAFQMSRYLPLLQQAGATVVLAASPPLIAFFKTLPQLGVSKWVTGNEMIPEFDYWIPIMSLPYQLHTELDTIPSLKPAWQFTSSSKQRLPKTNNNFRVGLVWEGSSVHINNENRSMPLSHFEPLLSNPQISFYSLQCGPSSHDIQNLGFENRLVNLEPKIKSWRDTAEFLLELDLLITVDTAIAHLCASLEKPTWILLAFCSDYRWLLDRSDSPWYPSARLFRQKNPKDWQSVITAIKLAIENMGFSSNNKQPQE